MNIFGICRFYGLFLVGGLVVFSAWIWFVGFGVLNC